MSSPAAQEEIRPRPTLKDVAERAGVSLRTVKKVVVGREPVPDATRQRVHQAATELGYRKNIIASALALAKRERIGLVYSEVTKAYFPEVERGFRRFAAEYHDYGLDVEFAIGHDTNIAGQEAVLDRMLADERITGVVLQPLSADGLNPAIDRLVAAGKPVITFGSDAPDSARLCYIGPNAQKAGRIGAQILANYIGKRGTALIISRNRAHMQTRQRAEGFHEMVAEFYPAITPVELLIDNADDTYQVIAERLRGEPVTGIFSTSADTSVAGRVLRDMERSDIVLVGFDLSEETATLMRQGYIKVVLEQNPDEFSYRALSLMFDYRFHQRVPAPVITTDISILTSECLP